MSGSTFLGALAPVVAAPFVGSFLANAALRWGEGESVVAGRSRCRSCGTTLGLADLVPIVSWLALRGRCRHCGAPIGAWYPLVELATLVVAVWAASLLEGLELWIGVLFGWTLLLLALTDLRDFTLPDRLTLPLAAAGLLLAAASDGETLQARALGALLGFLVFVVVRAVHRRVRGREGLGLGDAKLMAAAGAWTGWPALPSIVLVAAVAALVVAVVRRRAAAAERVPFGAYLCAATWLVWLYGPIGL